MKKKAFLLLLPLLAIGCSNVEMESLRQEQKEMKLNKNLVKIHLCDRSDEFCAFTNMSVDTIVVLNGAGGYRVVAEDEYLPYFEAPGKEVLVKTSDVLDMKVKQDTIFIKLIKKDVQVFRKRFWIYDRENNSCEFEVSDPTILWC